MKKRKQTLCTCDCCGIDFLKDDSELKRNKKLGRKIFCSRSCSGKALNNFGDKRNTKPPPHGKLKDEFSRFRDHMRRIRNRGKEYDIDVEYLKEIWDNQKGKCPYTGVEMILKGYNKKDNNNPLFYASVDRIDSNKGYIKDNIQWVCKPINFLKNDFIHEDVITMCKIIQTHYNNISTS
jgi:hypothetical protein